MALASIPEISREYVWVPVIAVGEDRAALEDLTVEMAFLTDSPPGEPEENDWTAGDWSPEVPYGYTAVARCLVGPATSAELAVGMHHVWVRLTGATERPVRYSGQLRIT